MSSTLLRPVDRCPGCGVRATTAKALFDLPFLGERARLLACPACGLRYKSLVPTQTGLSRIYATTYEHFQDTGPLDLGEIYSAKLKLATIHRLLGGPGGRASREFRMLDIGCGRGRFVAAARRLGVQAEGIDPFLPAELSGEHVRRGEPSDVPPASYDAATMLNVAEHLTDPHPLFAAARRLLRPGGVLLLSCPYGDSMARRFHRASWVHVALDEHLLFWTPRSLTAALRTDGFLGASRHRFSGSPFPYGRVTPAASPAPAVDVGPAIGSTPTRPTIPHTPPLSHRIQVQVWRVALQLMRREAASNAVRRAVDLTRSGDYLELAIATG
jgi:2-polyprenyl-3-methyl-5-hydroxy-6-metoxy-1,4-benzoquinol methylase